jgi:tetratricopeptide (TPR) repeat protein
MSRRERRDHDAETDFDLESELPSHVGESASPAEVREVFGEVERGHHASSVAHDDPLAHDIFERSSKIDDDLDEHEVIHQLSRGSRRAMYASLGIFAVSIVAIGGYTIYQNWIMPAPVELGATTLDIPAVPVAPAAVAVEPQPFVVHGSAAASTAAPAAETETQLAAATNPQQAAQAPTPAVPSAEAPAVHPSPSASVQAAVAPQVAAAQQGAVAQQVAAAQQVAQAPEAVAASQAAQVPQVVDTLAAAPAVAKPAAVVQPSAAAAPVAPVLLASAAAVAPAAPVQAEQTAPVANAVPVTAAKAQLAVAAKPDSDAPTDEASSATGAPTYDELVAAGRALSKKNRRAEASEAFRRALVRSPQGSAALSGLGFVYLNAEENQNAKEYAQRAVQADASNAEGWIVLGAALELLGDRAGAKDAYRNCVEQGQGPYLSECRKVAR